MKTGSLVSFRTAEGHTGTGVVLGPSRPDHVLVSVTSFVLALGENDGKWHPVIDCDEEWLFVDKEPEYIAYEDSTPLQTPAPATVAPSQVAPAPVISSPAPVAAAAPVVAAEPETAAAPAPVDPAPAS